MGGKRIALIISNEDLNEIVKVIKSLDNSGVMIDGVSETVKNEIKKWISWYVVRNFKSFDIKENDKVLESAVDKQKVKYKLLFRSNYFSVTFYTSSIVIWWPSL